MRKPKTKEVSLRADQLLRSGDIITVMDDGFPTICKVLSCLGTNDGSCFASLEILEGPRKGIRLETSLVPGKQAKE